MGWSSVLLLSAILAGSTVSAKSAGEARGVLAKGSSADRWLNLISDYAHNAVGSPNDDDNDNWFPRPIPVNLPIGRGEGGKTVSMPLLILPVPVPDHRQKTSSQCDQSGSKLPIKQSESFDDFDKNDGPVKPQGAQPYRPLHEPVRVRDEEMSVRAPEPAPALPAPTVPRQRQPDYKHYDEEPTVPHLDYIVSSQQLVELFQAQVAPNPEQPPVVFYDNNGGTQVNDSDHDPADVELDVEDDGGIVAGGGRARFVRMRRYHLNTPGVPAPPSYASLNYDATGAPAPPRFDRSLLLRGVLTVPRAGYSEPYTVWWDAGSGSARVDLHGGATSTYRTVMPDGRVRSVEMHVDRSGDGEVRRCATSAPRAPSAADGALPALPDLQPFVFTGYVQSEFGSVAVERWAYTLSGGGGELGGARGEALAFRHELLLTRAADNYTTTPLKYSVSVDSSVLGPNCDGYVHRYSEMRDQQHEPGLFVLDLVESCEVVQHLAHASRARFEPLLEFTMSRRDPRYDAMYQQFKSEHRRQYWNDTEEAVRKNLMMQHSRFVSSGNRQGATFNMKVNHLGDRLDAEMEVLRGVQQEAKPRPSERFPHSGANLESVKGHLPREFDWRTKGAVTHVRNQGTCSSCWAFAVTGAVEGVLFLRTRTLVPLSEQSLVDCAHPFGGHGCRGTWPSAAYSYVRERGLPALAEYTPYQEKVLTCVDKSVSPVTHISAHVDVPSKNVVALKVAIRRHSPTVVIIDATPKSFIFYKEGVFQDERCAKNKPEHAVLAVGWGVSQGQEHFILKNSYSDKWGDGGYVRVQAKSNTCGVLSRPSYPRLERPDVDRLPATATATATATANP